MALVGMELEISWEEKTVNEKEQQELSEILRSGVYEALKIGKGPEDPEITIVMVDDETIHLLNKNYSGVDRPTDVLSFALSEKGENELDINMDSLFDEVGETSEDELGLSDEDKLLYYEDSALGDIVISVERARAQALEYGHSFTREIVYLAVHGTFHLLGYDHHTDEDCSEMRCLEEQVMDKIGLLR